MVKFNEIGREIVKFTQEQLRNREARLATPSVKASIDRTQTLLKDDIKNSCVHAVEALYRFTFGAPLLALWEGMKEFGHVTSHNMSTKNPKYKKKYSEIPASMISELIVQYGKGTMSTTKFLGNVGLALGRATVLVSRYTIGK